MRRMRRLRNVPRSLRDVVDLLAPTVEPAGASDEYAISLVRTDLDVVA